MAMLKEKLKEKINEILKTVKNCNIQVKVFDEVRDEILALQTEHKFETINETIYNILNDFPEHNCPICGNVSGFKSFKFGYKKCCCQTCANKLSHQNPNVRERIAKSVSKYNSTVDQYEWNERANKLRETISNRTPDEVEFFKDKKSKTTAKVHAERSEEYKQEVNQIISEAVKNSEKAKLQRIQRSILGQKALQEKIQSMSEEDKTQHFRKQQASREKYWIENFGVTNVMQIDDIKNRNHEKMKQTNYDSGHWMRDDQLEDVELYNRQVKRNQDEKLIEKLEGYLNRGRADLKPGYFHLDHKYSKRQGFDDGILPYLIGHIVNLEFITGPNNCSKGKKCSISFEDLIKYYEEFEDL